MRFRSNKRISIIVQGPIVEQPLPNGRKTTEYALASCRKIFPNAEIVLSTWQGSKTEGLSADRIVFNDDPGPQGLFKAGAVSNNVNRQIVGTAAGIKTASNDLVLKLRSDAILLSANFIEIFDLAKRTSSQYNIFERKIVSNNLSSKNPDTMPDFPLLYHPADHAHFGLKNDLLKLWDIPLQSEEDALYFVNNTRPNSYRDEEASRFTPEQHICIQCFKKTKEIGIENYADVSEKDLSTNLLTSNFTFVDDCDFSFYLDKYHNYAHEVYKWMRFDGRIYAETQDHKKIEMTGHLVHRAFSFVRARET